MRHQNSVGVEVEPPTSPPAGRRLREGGGRVSRDILRPRRPVAPVFARRVLCTCLYQSYFVPAAGRCVLVRTTLAPIPRRRCRRRCARCGFRVHPTPALVKLQQEPLRILCLVLVAQILDQGHSPMRIDHRRLLATAAQRFGHQGHQMPEPGWPLALVDPFCTSQARQATPVPGGRGRGPRGTVLFGRPLRHALSSESSHRSVVGAAPDRRTAAVPGARSSSPTCHARANIFLKQDHTCQLIQPQTLSVSTHRHRACRQSSSTVVHER